MQVTKISPVEEIRVDIISQIWKIVHEKYPLFTERDIDWENIKLKYLRGIKTVTSYENLYKYIDRMLIELKDPHTRIITSPWFQKSIYPLVLVNIDDDLYIPFCLNANSKLKAGMKIIKVNHMPIEVIRETIYEQFPFKSASVRKAALIKELMSGDFGNTIEITATDGYTYETEVLAKKEASFISQDTNKLTPSSIKISPCLAKTFSDIGYIKIFTFKHKNIFQDFLKTLSGCGNIKSLIIDVRGNQGGLINETSNVTSLFVSEERLLGYRVNKKGDCEAIRVKPLPSIRQSFNKIIVLCDESTMSSAEFIFVSALKGSSKNIQVVGNQTAGLVHEATIFPLFDGTKLQVTTFKYLDINGRVRDEVGIEPDVEVHNSVNLLTKRQDDQLNHALKLCLA